MSYSWGSLPQGPHEATLKGDLMRKDCGCDPLRGEKCRLHDAGYDMTTCPECGSTDAARIRVSKKIVCMSCGKGM